MLAALYQRERTGRGQWIDVSMAETMLYVNEHLHDQLWDGRGRRQHHPQLRPRRLPRVRGRRRRRPSSSAGTPPSVGTFELFLRGLRCRAPRRRSRASPTSPARLANFDALRVDAARRGALRSPTRRRSRSSSAPTSSRPACCAPPASWPRRTGRVTAGRSPRSPIAAAARSASPTRRGTSATPRSAVRGEPRYRGEDNRTVARRAARLRRRRRSTAWRPTGCSPAGCHHRGRDAVVSRGPDEGGARDAADRGRRVGVRGQVGRLPHARLRRGRPGAAAELEPARRHRQVPGDAGARRGDRACGGPSSTASSSCSTTTGGRGSS